MTIEAIKTNKRAMMCKFIFFVCAMKSRSTQSKFLYTYISKSSLKNNQTAHWIITINGKINVWKCKLIFPPDTLQQKIEITDLKTFLAAENTRVWFIFGHNSIYVYRKNLHNYGINK